MKRHLLGLVLGVALSLLAAPSAQAAPWGAESGLDGFVAWVDQLADHWLGWLASFDGDAVPLEKTGGAMDPMGGPTPPPPPPSAPR